MPQVGHDGAVRSVDPQVATGASQVIQVGTGTGSITLTSAIHSFDWLILSGSKSGGWQLIIPRDYSDMWMITNNSGQTVTVTASSGSTVTIANGKSARVGYQDKTAGMIKLTADA